MATARHLLTRCLLSAWRLSPPSSPPVSTTTTFGGVSLAIKNPHSPFHKGWTNGFRSERSIFDSRNIGCHSHKHERRQESQVLFLPSRATNSRSIHSKSEPPVTHGFSEGESSSGSSSTTSISMEAVNPGDQAPNSKDKVLSELRRSSRHDLMMIFTCKVCQTRSVKTTCRQSYEKGIVIVRCDGCKNLHLIADRLGWFGEPGSVEDLLAAQGEEVQNGSMDTLNFTLEDLVGTKS